MNIPPSPDSPSSNPKSFFPISIIHQFSVKEIVEKYHWSEGDQTRKERKERIQLDICILISLKSSRVIPRSLSSCWTVSTSSGSNSCLLQQIVQFYSNISISTNWSLFFYKKEDSEWLKLTNEMKSRNWQPWIPMLWEQKWIEGSGRYSLPSKFPRNSKLDMIFF